VDRHRRRTGRSARLGIRCFVNGEKRQDSNTQHLVFNVWQQVEHLSQAMTLEPGDCLFTGTPGGVGAAMDPRQFLQGGRCRAMRDRPAGPYRRHDAGRRAEGDGSGFDCDVLIAGGGPTGVTLAVLLAQRGVRSWSRKRRQIFIRSRAPRTSITKECASCRKRAWRTR
jgi:hypothetical protein